MTLLLCAGCFLGLIYGVQSGFAWWVLVLLGIGTFFFFLAGPIDDD